MTNKKNTFGISSKGLITLAELKEKMKNEDPYLLDVRKKEDFDKNQIEGSIHSEWEDVADLIQDDKLPKDRTIAVICYNGQSSMQIATVLKMQGYDAYSLLDGIEGWMKEEDEEKEY